MTKLHIPNIADIEIIEEEQMPKHLIALDNGKSTILLNMNTGEIKTIEHQLIHKAWSWG